VPWLGFFTYGILIDRIPRGKWELIAIPAFLAMFVAAHWLPELEGQRNLVVMVKVNPRFIFMNCGLMPAMFLAARRWYRPRGPISRMIESWGVESLVFLIFHWGVIFVLNGLASQIRSAFGDTAAVWTLAVLTLAVMSQLVPVVARIRDRWLKSPKFARRAWTIYLGSLLLWGLSMVTTFKWAMTGLMIPAAGMRLLAVFFAFGAGATFCFLYPHLRIQIRNRSMRTPATNP